MPRPTYTAAEALKNFDAVLRRANKPGGVTITMKGQKPVVLISAKEIEAVKKAVRDKAREHRQGIYR